MKKLLIAFAFLLLPLSALASVGDMPSEDALSYGQNAQGCYYLSEKQAIVYSKDFSVAMGGLTNCNRSFKFKATTTFEKVVMKWREARQAFLQELAKGM